jgi:hypothetical protein
MDEVHFGAVAIGVISAEQASPVLADGLQTAVASDPTHVNPAAQINPWHF